MNFDAILSRLTKKENLSPEEIASAIERIMAGSVDTPQIESFLVLLRQKGETAAEIAAAAKVMRKHAVHFKHSYPETIDTCGTGGDAQNTLNVSTLSAIVACAAGVKIAKHGNRSVSSVCGSADLLELLGVKADLAPEKAEKCLEATGFAFLFAPLFHPAVKHAMAARRNIQGKTLFNLLGPLTNPAGVKRQVIGVYSQDAAEKTAEALRLLGLERALVVHGSDGLDEISISDSTYTAELKHGVINHAFVAPEAVKLKRRPIEEIRCASKDDNKKKALDVLAGKPGAPFDIVCFNAAAAIWIAGEMPLVEAFETARETLLSGKAKSKLEEIRRFTQDA